MTFRPSQQSVSRREAVAYTKAVRALAHKGGMTAHKALNKLDGYRTTSMCCDKPWGIHPDRGAFYVSHIQVDDGMLHLDDEDVYDFKVDFPGLEEPKRQTDLTVSLIDIAKPARRRGRAKKQTRAHDGISDWELDDFVELDEADAFSIFSEDWEDLYGEGDSEPEGERTYSAVLRAESTTKGVSSDNPG